MYIYLTDKLDNFDNVPEKIKKDFKKFVKKIESFWYFEEKHFEKVKIFSENNDLLDYLLFLTNDLNPFFETDKDFSYLLLVLSYSENESAIKYLENLTDSFIEKQARGDLLLRIFSFVKSFKLQNSLEKLQKYFEKLYEKSDYFTFTRNIGIDLSSYNFQKTGGEGYFSFALTTVSGKEYDFQCEEEEKKNFYKIEFSFFTPSGTDKCFNIELMEPFYKISFFDWEKDYVLSEKSFTELHFKDTNQRFIIENGEKLLYLPETFKKIEEVLGVKFSLEKIYFSFTKGIKGKKNLEKWILEKFS